MKKDMHIGETLQLLKKRMGLILCCIAISTAISGIVNFYVITPMYESSTQILVNQEKSEQQFFNVGEIQTNLQLINTYSGIIKSPAILEIVKEELKEELKLDLSVKQLDSQIQVINKQDSQIIYITVKNSSPVLTAKIANTTAKVFKQKIVEIMNVNNVSILAKGEVPTDPVSPNPVSNLSIGFFLGGMIGILLTFMLNYFDNTVKNEQDVEQFLNSPIIGVVMAIEPVVSSRNQGSSIEPHIAKGGSANV